MKTATWCCVSKPPAPEMLMPEPTPPPASLKVKANWPLLTFEVFVSGLLDVRAVVGRPVRRGERDRGRGAGDGHEGQDEDLELELGDAHQYFLS